MVDRARCLTSVKDISFHIACSSVNPEDHIRSLHGIVRMPAIPFSAERIEPVEARDISGGLVKGYWIGSPVNYTTEVTILYIHSGAFVAGHPVQSCHGLADLLHVLYRERGIIARIFPLQYPLAPERPYPAALEASVRAVQWLIDSVGARKLFLRCVPISPFVDFLGPRSPPNFSASSEPSSELDSSDEKVFGSNADFLGLPTGRVAVRYYLGTKANGWYERERAWPNLWNKTQGTEAG
ncbi:hypothetical protein M427DRAFT_43279 [Gonapodya prolifera JEL478]|uniref:Alpha/beta hydrolase fold-3 domain-containing protein n=1 Tax=Gonapodya prolifera (strain JEL478) TaxID=1344416 RepID=A0A139AJR9_GONPJ|nr:hypothetical protein M427DRAFT_43279 [Gonapodya prolifera JEL478]|eukprot:KXS17011.1 hypothetical protein M427DRAFT_43279 [Gonapodya prolifera JEL478]